MSGLWSTDRPAFIERVAKLAGGTTYRTPDSPRSAKSDCLPDSHAIATALSFSRKGFQDIGPDVAYCWALQNDSYRVKVTRTVCDALCSNGKITRDQVAVAVGWAWESMIHGRSPKGAQHPLVDKRAWDALVTLVAGILYNSAWDSLADAERSYMKEG